MGLSIPGNVRRMSQAKVMEFNKETDSESKRGSGLTLGINLGEGVNGSGDQGKTMAKGMQYQMMWDMQYVFRVKTEALFEYNKGYVFDFYFLDD